MDNEIKKPPRFAERMLRIFANRNDNTAIIGDLEEEFHRNLNTRGPLIATVSYWMVTMISLPSFIYDLFFWRTLMLRNYFKMALRNIQKHKGYTFINITGLAVGLASCILIMMYLKHELIYDDFHKNANRLVRAINTLHLGGTVRTMAQTPGPIGPYFTESIPEITQFSRVTRAVGRREVFVKVGDQKFAETRMFHVDSTFFQLFSYEFISGQPDNTLLEPGKAVITDKAAHRLFGSTDVIGKEFIVEGLFRNRPHIVSAVIKDMSHQSHLQFDYLFPMSLIYNARRPEIFEDWLWFPHYTYFLLEKGADPNILPVKMQEVFRRYAGDYADEYNSKLDLDIQNVTDIHLKSHIEMEISANGDIRYVRYLTAIAIFVLLIASVNFINLTTAGSSKRAKEVGLRKVFGSHRQQLIGQFICEAILLTVIGLFFAILIIGLVLPAFNQLSGLSLSWSNLSDSTILVGSIFLLLLIGAGAGSYPAFMLSSFRPVAILRGQLSKGASNPFLRKILVIFQFSVSIILVACTMIVLKQVNFMKSHNLGFNADQAMVIEVKERSTFRNNVAVKSQLLANPAITHASFATNIPGQDLRGITAFLPEGRDVTETTVMISVFVDYDYFDLFEMELAHGRLFQKELSSDSTDAYVVNEAAVRLVGSKEDLLGKRLRNITAEHKGGIVIGILNDYHHESLKEEIAPIVFKVLPRGARLLTLKIRSSNMAQTIAGIREIWTNEIEPGRDMNYFFVDERFDSLYRSEERLSQIFSSFSAIGIIIACLGLFGLVSFITLQRTKEVGIRKTLGASVTNIYLLLSKEFIQCVLLASFIAVPFVWYTMGSWLNQFPVRTNIGVGTYLLSGLMGLLVAFVTTWYRVIVTAKSNPVDALKYE